MQREPEQQLLEVICADHGWGDMQVPRGPVPIS